MELGLDQEFLDDPATVYPVVVDPDVAFAWGFDTWVSQDWKYTDKSGETFLRVGGVPGTARTFIHFGVGPFAGKQVLAADISLWATWSYSCQPRNWELWDTSFASTGTRWGAQPAWYSKWSVSDETQGYSSACGDGWVTIDAQALAQAWADNGHLGDVALGLKAENESDPYALKEFNSANAGDNVPTLWVRYNTRPTPSTDLAVTPSNVVDGVVYTNHATPSLSAIGHDPDGDWLSFVYRLHRGVNGPQLWQTTRTGEQGVAVSVPVSAHGGSLVDGESYDYVVHAADSSGAWNTHYSDWKRIVADLTPPPAPVSVSSSTYPSDTGWHGDVGVAGTFTVALGAGEANPHGFIWAVDGPPVDTNRVLGSDFSWTPSAAGRHVLNVRAIDKAGNLSPVVSYPFNVGRGAIVSPMEGTRVVRRARLEIQADPTLTDVRFEWRAGPDASAIHAVPAGVLSTASGAPFGADRIALSTLGSYATLDAAALLGFRRGPFQVRPVFRAGTGPDVQGAWVSLFVDPDADGASADQVGPGGVNLITGDYTLSSEDADEFGVLVGRTASSRDPRAGFQPQAEILSASQRTISDVTGFESDAALFEKVTDRWHAGGDGLRVRPLSLGTNTFVSVGGDVGGVRLGLKGGSTYRFTGWAYVPAATGLSPDHAERGLRLAAFTRVGSDPYQWTLSEKVQATDTWQFLSVDFTVPEGVTEAFVRVYNGFQQGSGKEVFYDDLSLRELWAPVGPQWSLGSADDAAGTDYEKVEKPDEETVVVHAAGGGEIWFTAAGSGAWVPELGAEGLVLTSQGDDWTLSELDGTVTHFSPATAGGPALMTTTAPPAAAGQTRMVYQGEAGEFPKQLSRVEVWSTNPASGAVEKQTVVEYRYDSAGRLTQMWDPRVTPALKTVYGYDQAGHVTSLTPAGELPWRFAYAAGGQRTSASGDLIDANPGRLQSVTRASLVEGSASQAGPDNTTTVLYGVPLARADGGPYNLDENALGSWAQRGAPTDATAVFGPHAPPSVTEPTASAPGADGYATATVHYLDASGREVNTASPIGGTGVDANLKRIGFIDSAEFDQYGNTIRTLDATNRLIALGVGATASADLLELNLASMPTAERALRLSATSTYSADGLDLLSSVGPAQRVSTAAGMEVVRLRTANTYDEGKPDAQAYHLVTTSTTSAQPVDHPNDPSRGLDSVTTRTGYAPTAQLGGTSGWVVKKPTSVTVGEGAQQVGSQIKYDDKGRVLASRRPSVAGVADWGTRSIYYTAGANPDDAACGNRPEWAGQACVSKPETSVEGSVAARMGDTLPTRRITQYSQYGTPLQVTETSSGAGATERTTTTTLDAAERTHTVATTVTGSGAGTGVATVTTVYDAASGHAVESVTGQGSVTRTLDQLGRTLTYSDASGATATSTYDRYGQPKTYTEKNAVGALIGSRSFTYDRVEDPRGFLTSISDSVAGTISATYGADGQVLTQSLPGGVSLEIGYDATRAPVSRTYSYGGQVVASSAITVNTQGKWASHTTSASSSSYTYDALGRLTGAQQTVNGVCTWREYDFNARSDRTAKRSKTVSGGCTPGAMGSPDQTINYTYDSADRLVADTSGSGQPWAYDGLGRMTGYRSALDPDVTVTSTYFDNDRIKSQSTPDGASMAWTLDPLGRFDTITSTPAGGTATVKQNHYTDDGDSPSWIGEDTSDPGPRHCRVLACQ
ncbi:MAG: hypothetical protein IPL36_11195 [Nigerium sp.]|nr:hypothetical protein [Nigerium sp.]